MASVTTRYHDEIRQWATAHGAVPSVVSSTGGMLRFEFAPEPPAELAEVSWREFFRIFDERGLELVYDDKPGSRFHKLIYPETAAARARGERQPAKPARSRQRAQVHSIKSQPRAAEREGGKTRETKSGSRAGKSTRGKTPRRPSRKAA